MSTTSHGREFEFTMGYIGNVAFAGLLAGFLMGGIMHQVMGVMQAVGALYTIETTGAGWAFHLAHSLIFAIAFGGFFLWSRIMPFRDQVLASTTLGIAWGAVLWLVAAGVVMPAWLGAVGAPNPGVPTWNPWSGLGHVLYGAVLGGGAALLHKRSRR